MESTQLEEQVTNPEEGDHLKTLEGYREFLKRGERSRLESESRKPIQLNYVEDLDKKIQAFKDAFDKAQNAILG